MFLIKMLIKKLKKLIKNDDNNDSNLRKFVVTMRNLMTNLHQRSRLKPDLNQI